MIKNCYENVKTVHPLIHNITNYVTVNDCANMLLACGASPIMADELMEVEDITTICAGLNINIGTLQERTILAMEKAGKKANQLGHVILLDPVGVGASALRSNTAQNLMKHISFTVVRGNISEIKALALGSNTTLGVDANALDLVTAENLSVTIEFVQKFAREAGTIIAISGAIDVIADGTVAYAIYNGVSQMADVTGSGCMLSALTTAFLAANPDNPLEATVASFCAMGICGEKAYEEMKKEGFGNGTMATRLVDHMYHLTPEELEARAKYEIFQ